MTSLIRVGAVAVLVIGVAGEAARVVAAPGVSVVLGLCLSTYMWFLAIARRASGTPQRRKR